MYSWLCSESQKFRLCSVFFFPYDLCIFAIFSYLQFLPASTGWELFALWSHVIFLIYLSLCSGWIFVSFQYQMDFHRAALSLLSVTFSVMLLLYTSLAFSLVIDFIFSLSLTSTVCHSSVFPRLFWSIYCLILRLLPQLLSLLLYLKLCFCVCRLRLHSIALRFSSSSSLHHSPLSLSSPPPPWCLVCCHWLHKQAS